MQSGNIVKRIICEKKGSTLITVIVAISFVTILAAIILGASLTNFRMKAIDRRAKDDFYYTEKALNDIYTGLGQEISVIAANAYDAAFSSVGMGKVKDGASLENVETAQEAEKYYKKKFFTDVKSWLDTNANPVTFQKYIVPTTAAEKESYVIDNGAYSVVVEDNGENEITNPAQYVTSATCIRIKDVNVVCADTNKDYKGEITTDIVITLPKLGFFDENADIVDYALIANKGINVDGNLDVKDGNVYAGLFKVDENESDGGLKINKGDMKFEGNYLISKGNIEVGSTGNSASFTAGLSRSTRPNIWFNSLITKQGATEPSIDINANTFALNDVELNGNKSNVVITGSFYGYNDGTLATPMLIDKGTEHADNSAIIINGNGCKLDLGLPSPTNRDLSTLMLMGKAYIEANGDEISTAEALALRTNQQLYLVPPDFLECANPISGKKLDTDWGCNIPSDWFGYEYLKKDISTGKPVIQTVVTGNDSMPDDSRVSYAFFTFDDSRDYDLSDSSSFRQLGGSAHNKARTAFVYEIVHGDDSNSPSVQPTQSQLKTRIANSLANYDNFFLQKCVVNNTSSSNVFSMNALTDYAVDYTGVPGTKTIGATTMESVQNTIAKDRYDSYPQNLFHRYQWLCTMLIPNEDIPLSKTVGAVQSVYATPTPNPREVRKIDEESPWMADSSYPFKYYVRTPDTLIADETADATRIPEASYGKFIYSTSSISFASNTTFNGFAISTQDINVGLNTKINGTLIAKGKINFEGGNVVKSDRALIQKRISKEIELVKEDGKYRKDYLISYLDNGKGGLLYGNITSEGKSKIADDERTDYTEYIYYENWKKGGR